MSRFNSKNTEKDAQEWSAIALRDNLGDRSGHLVVAGIIGGGLLASATTPLLGGVFATYCLIKGIQSAFAADKNKRLIANVGCVAHVLKGQDFRSYLRQVGSEKVFEELSYADDENMALSPDAADFMDDYLENLNTVPKITSNQQPTESHILNQASNTHVPLSEMGHQPITTILKEFRQETPNLPRMLAKNLKLSLIVGVPGSGKGIFVTNALDEVRKLHKNVTVFYIDPKNDPKETSYFSGRVDHLYRKDLLALADNPKEGYDWIRDCLKDYESFDCGVGRKLLVFDELNLTLKTLKSVSVAKGEQSPFEWLRTKLTGYSSSGDSRGIVLWGISQNAHVSGLGLDGGDRTMFVPIFIVDVRNLSASEGILNARMIPGDKRLDSTQIQELCSKSEVGRAVYDGVTNRWYPMPTLTNFSGYNRDKREFVDGYAPPPPGDKLINNYDDVASLESTLKKNSPVDDLDLDSGLSFEENRVLTFFRNAKNREPKPESFLSRATNLRDLKEQMQVILDTLVQKEYLVKNFDNNYALPDW